MGHCIHAIVAPHATANTISIDWPELSQLNRDNGFAIFPVEAELIDRKIAPDDTPTATGDEFMLLTNGFRNILRAMSAGGVLAYVETEYFGGIGGQGALVCRNGEEIMPPTWTSSGTINDALELIGVPRGLLFVADRFTAMGLGNVRSNDDLFELIAAQASDNEQ